MASNKPNGRRTKARFAGIPHMLMESPNYAELNGWDVKLLLEIVKQHNGSNNGDLCATWKLMKASGWRSPSTLSLSIKRLEHYGFIEQTRQGGRHSCNLYGLTWYPIEECKGKLDIKATSRPSDNWKIPAKPYSKN